MLSVAFPLAPCPKNRRCPTMVSTERYAQIIVGLASLSHATHRFPPSSGILGDVRLLRASIAEALPVQKRLPQSGVATPRTGSPLVAEIAALGNRADEPTATIGIACAELDGANANDTIASASNALQIFHIFMKLLLSEFCCVADSSVAGLRRGHLIFEMSVLPAHGSGKSSRSLSSEAWCCLQQS